MTDDGDRFDDIIDDAARDYNRAPETPRAEMWERIQAGRTRSAGTHATPVGGASARDNHMPASRPDIIPIHDARRRQMWWAVGLAATLLLGIGIGRISMHRGDGSSRRDTVVAAMPVPSSPTVVGSQPDAQGVGATPGSANADSGEGVRRSPRQLAVANASQRDDTSPTTRDATERSAERRASEMALPYRLAASEHLAMTEALLVSLRADMKSGRRDTTVAAWATNLLGTTRMLLDSPASKDVQMKKLLEDLELVLAQIARLPAASGDSTDLELIDKAVKQRQVLTRLRAIEPRT